MVWYNEFIKRKRMYLYIFIYTLALGFSFIFILYESHRLNLKQYVISSVLFLLLMYALYSLLNKFFSYRIAGRRIVLQRIEYQLPFNEISYHISLISRIIRKPLKVEGYCIPTWAYYKKSKKEVCIFKPLNNLSYPLQLHVVKYSRSGLALVKSHLSDDYRLVDLRNAKYML